MPHRYRHTQTGFVIIALSAVVLVLGLVPLLSAGYTPGLILLGAIVAFLLGGFGSMTISVDERSIEARLGVGLLRKRVEFSELRGYRRVKNPWYFGWGMRWIPGGWLYNVSGVDAVELVLAGGKLVRFGTDEPEALLSALGRTKGKSAPLGAHDEAQLKRRTARYLILIALVLGLPGAALAGLFTLEMRPPRSELRGDSFAVRSTIYGAEVPLRDISAVSLERQLPRIRMRTNGFALGRTLRGHFRVDELGDGQLFIQLGFSPYLVVRTRDSFVSVNFEDPARTTALYAELASRVKKR